MLTGEEFANRVRELTDRIMEERLAVVRDRMDQVVPGDEKIREVADGIVETRLSEALASLERGLEEGTERE